MICAILSEPSNTRTRSPSFTRQLGAINLICWAGTFRAQAYLQADPRMMHLCLATRVQPLPAATPAPVRRAAPLAATCRQRLTLRPTAAQRRGQCAVAAAAVTGRFEDPASAAGPVVVEVLPDEAAVADFLCSTVEAAAAAAIAERGVFTLAIPGGSVLKALGGLAQRTSIPWAEGKVKLFFVNHKTCVPNDDSSTSSYAKARKLFLDAVGAPEGSVATLTGSDDAEVGGSGAVSLLRGWLCGCRCGCKCVV